MKTLLILILICLLLSLFGCRENFTDDNFKEVYDWNGTQVSSNFKWSTTKEINLIVNIDPLQEGFDMMNKLIYLLDQDGNILRKKLVQGPKVEFQTQLGSELRELYLYCPDTGNIMELTTINGQETFPMAWSSVKIDSVGLEFHEDFASFKNYLIAPPNEESSYIEYIAELNRDVLVNVKERVKRKLNYLTLSDINKSERNPPISKSTKTIFEDNIENGNKGWKNEVLNQEDQVVSKDNSVSWQIVNQSPFTGSSWQTVITHNSINQEALVNVLTSPLIDLRNYRRHQIHLSFDHFYSFATQYWGALEGGIVQISQDQGLTWVKLVPEKGYNGITSTCSNYLFGQRAYTYQNTEKASFNLNAFAGKIIQIRFLVDINSCYYYNADPSLIGTSWVPAGNWKIDNILITATLNDQDGDSIRDDMDEFPDDSNLAFTRTYPASGYKISAFEDLWPALGDYDMNDVVISSRMTYYLNASQLLIKIDGELYINALGSVYHNGLALQILDINKQPLTSNLFDQVSGDAQKDPNVPNGLIISNNLFETIPTFYKNNGEAPSASPHKMTFTIQVNRCAQTRKELIADFYIFRNDDRGHEIHLPGYPPTSRANTSLFYTSDDATNPSNNQWYITQKNLPWGIEIISNTSDYQHPLERIDIREAYPKFSAWVASNGENQQDWFLFPVPDKVFHFE